MTTTPLRVDLEEMDGLTGFSLRTLSLAALGHLLPAQAGDQGGSEEARLLHSHVALVGALPSEAMIEASLLDPQPEDLPLLDLREELGLSLVETLAVALAAAVEHDLLIGRAVAYLQAPTGGSRPTIGLLSEAFRDFTDEPLAPLDQLLTGAAASSGLLVIAGGAPIPERTVAVPEHLCLALRGLDAPVAGVTVGISRNESVPLPASFLAAALDHATALGEAEGRLLVIRSASPSEGKSAANAIALKKDLHPLFLPLDHIPPGLGPWLRLRHLLPVFALELGPGERKLLPTIRGYDGPLVAVLGPDGVAESAGAAALTWSLPVAARAEREQLWRSQITTAPLSELLARQNRHGCGRIAHLSRLARHRAALRGDDLPVADDVRAAAWSGEGAGLETLAQAVTDAVPDEALVLPPLTRSELEELLLRCRWRDELTAGLGASAVARYHPGVRALLIGPSGTGKTLAVAWLATRLGLPLYRVDLASVTSKYIGETEKNLAQLLARAEQAEVILLFDEADSIFGKRTDVRDANDRFANAQTNYLLQRIEYYDGIVILTSNTRGRFDSAFTRRLDTVIEFPLPGPAERRDLWLSHLGAGHTLGREEINLISARADFGGGHIRNAVLAAAVRGRDGGRPIGFQDVLSGISAELRKLGRQVSIELKPAVAGLG